MRHQDESSDETNTKTDAIMQPDNQVKNGIKIKHEIDSNSDIEVDLAYRIIDTFNVCQVKSFKQEDEKILPDTNALLIIDQTHTKVEVDKQIGLDVGISSNVNVCDKEKTAMRTENVDYDNLNLEDDMNKQHFHKLQIKGMWVLIIMI